MRRTVTTLATFLAVAAAACVGSQLQAGLVVYDSFTGAAGASDITTHTIDIVNGGTASWHVNNPAYLTGNGTVSVPAASKNSDVASQASILLPGAASQYNGNGSILSIKTKVTVSAPGSWVSIGFSTDNNPWSWGMNSSDTSMLLQARLGADGNYQIYVGNVSRNGGQIANFNASAAHTIVLTRDNWWNVNLYIDDVKVVDNSYLAWAAPLTTPNAGNGWGQASPGVGFRMNPGTSGVGENSIDYFAAGTGDYAIPVPEAASLSLLTIGAAGMVVRVPRAAR